MYVGSVSAFTSSAAQKCGRCRNNWDIELEGFIHLDEVLKLSSIPTLSTDMVQPFLAEHLRVEVKGRKPDGTLANIEHDLPSLKVAPFSQAIHLDTFYGVPNAGKVTYHHDILVGKPGHTPADRW
ncbi:hypothetical protein C8Q72DRAFT_853563 [Fomitopsis betulina]|nr:hypothetical protein C8Q72DRAFT_853563 [Fomitopsis betulina]